MIVVFSQLEALIDKALSRIQFESDNHLFSPKDLNIEYVSMRKEQLRYLKRNPHGFKESPTFGL